jgi:acyl-CoA reductase-like NAD-dependent aldehyde dehydrogenase
MSTVEQMSVPLAHTDRFYIGGEWVTPTTDAMIDVIDSDTEELYFRVAEGQVADVERAVSAARDAFDVGPWPRLTPQERAEYIRALGNAIGARTDDIGQIWPRESGVTHSAALASAYFAPWYLDSCAALADSHPFEEVVRPTAGGDFGLVVHEPVGVVGAIVPWNSPMGSIVSKLGPALLAGCTVVLKSSPEAPGEAYLVAEAAEAIGLPPGVVNVVTAHREASEHLVTDPRVDKIAFTGSTATGRRIASLCSDRVARFTLELGGKSAAVILDDADLGTAAAALAGAECFLSGQVCMSLTRIIVTRSRHDAMLEALASAFSQVHVGSPFDPETHMGPLASERQRERVEGYIAKGVAEGATLATGGGRPRHLDRGFYVEPTVFGNVDNGSTIGRDEIFGPVLSLIAAEDEDHAVALANDTIYGLNASVFTPDVDRARAVAARLRSGTVGHNAMRTDFGMSFGGFKQSGVGREGLHGGLEEYLETKSVILDGTPQGYPSAAG